MAVHLIVGEHDGKDIKKASLSALAAAKNIAEDCVGLIWGKEVKSVADSFSGYMGKVHYANNEDLEYRLAQPYAKVIADLAIKIGATHVWAAATVSGKDIMPRVAARLNAGMASDIQAVVDDKTFERAMWAGDITGTVEIKTPIKVVTVRGSEFDPSESVASGEIIEFRPEVENHGSKFVSFEEVKSERPELTDADIVISGGRGLKGKEGFKEIIEPLADRMGAAIGASRAVCDAGWVPNDWQVGQTGKIVAPKLYIAIGISGAIQHVAGIKSSKCIVAINKDPEAPIFQVADYGLVADAFIAVPELLERLK